MKHIGVDLGTSNTILYVKGKNILLREPSVVAVEERTKQVKAVGNAAKLMLGKTPGSIVAVQPLKDGVIAEYGVAAEMLRTFIRKVAGGTLFSRPRVIVCVPYGVTEVEKRAVEDVTLDAGAQQVTLIEEPIAAAIGAGLRVGEATGSMIIDVGGGTTEVAVLSMGGIVQARSLRVGGDELDEAIVGYIRRKYSVLIGISTAELLKKTIGSVHPMTDRGAMDVRGRNLMNGLPATLTIRSGEIREAMMEQMGRIVDCVRSAMESTPPELSSDIYDNGIVVTGGLALMPGFQLLLQQITGIKTFVAKNPLDSVAVGIGRVIEAQNDNIGLTYRAR